VSSNANLLSVLFSNFVVNVPNMTWRKNPTTLYRSSRLFDCFLIVVIWVLMGTGTLSAAAQNQHSVAVIIGNKNYKGQTPNAGFAHNDAQAMRKFVLEDLGYRTGNIIDLRDATRNEIEEIFGNEKTPEGKLFDWVKAKKSDVLVFYSGHGVLGLKDGRSYLLPVDGNADRAETTGYSIELLYSNLAKTPARSITVFIDAYFSGRSASGILVRSVSGLTELA